MTNYNLRKLPAGIQSFKKIREENYLYVDKTDIIWNSIINGYKYNFFIRPRRFGKSLLVDTLQSYFEGKKELFEGLKIMSLEKEWKSYPVVRLDMSMAVKAYFDDGTPCPAPARGRRYPVIASQSVLPVRNSSVGRSHEIHEGSHCRCAI